MNGELTLKLVLKKRDMAYSLFLVLLMYMPFHYYICELLLPMISVDNLLRDVIIVVLFIRIVATLKIRINYMWGFVTLNILILTVSALLSYAMYAYQGTFNILRTYVIPSLMFFICANLKLDKKRLANIHNIICVELALLAIYGFIQAFFLGDDFLIRLGYPNENGYLGSSSYYINGFWGKQRVVATFISPNICGVVLAIGLCVILFGKLDIQKKWKKLIIISLIIGLLGTLSRSAIVGMLFVIIFYMFVQKTCNRISLNKIIMIIVIACIMVLSIIAIDNYYLDGLFGRMLQSSIKGVLSMEDTSAVKHWQDLFEPIQIVFEHPFGLGFGNNGPMALSNSDTANAVESSIYVMMYEVGIVGGLLYFVPYIMIIVNTLKNRKYKYYLPACVLAVCIITFCLLPNVQTYEILFYAHLFMGLYCNPDVKRIYLGD